MRISNPKLYHVLKYMKNFKKYPNLKNPSTITEIILKNLLEGKISQHYYLADKIEAKEYVRKRVGDKYIVNNLFLLDRIEDINVSQLPEKFVVKTNNSCETNYFCYNKENFDKSDCIITVNNWLKVNYGALYHEIHYKLIEPRVFIEEFIESPSGQVDYKFFCFNGTPYFVQVINQENKEQKFYDMDWKEAPFKFSSSTISKEEFFKPSNFEEMIDVAKGISQDIDFCRIDLYNVEGKILFGEITLTPKGGYLKFEPSSYNKKFGDIYYEELSL